MKRSYFPRQFWSLSGVLVGMVLLFALSASAQAPSIEGTYQLISRKLSDGTVLKPPDIMGLGTFTKSHRNFNIVLKDATGKFSSFSFVSTYTLTATEFTQTLLFSIRTDQIGGKDIVYDLSGQTRSTPVTVEARRIQFKENWVVLEKSNMGHPASRAGTHSSFTRCGISWRPRGSGCTGYQLES